jgi:two-component system phosphate regulon response regulator OmpR
LSRNRELESFDRSVDIQVSRLRKKIEDDVKAPLFIVTVRGAGYRFSTQQGD